MKAIRAVLDARAGLSVPARRIRTGDDLFALGLSGLAAVDVMLAVEAAFGVEFPKAMLRKANVQSIDVLMGCLRALQKRPLAA